MTRHTIAAEYAVETMGPLHIGTGQGVAGLHRAMLRDQHGLPYIPGSTIKGRARYAAIKICEWLNLSVSKDSVDDVRLLGSASFQANGPAAALDLPQRIFGTAWSRCTLRFTDARAAAPNRDPDTDQSTQRRLLERGYGFRELRTGTGRSRLLGTVGQGLLYQSEVAPPASFSVAKFSELLNAWNSLISRLRRWYCGWRFTSWLKTGWVATSRQATASSPGLKRTG